MVDGERLSYRTLDVEQIGSVYQSVMGFTIELTTVFAGDSPEKVVGASATINLEILLAEPAAKRVRAIQKRTDTKVTVKVGAAVMAAKTVVELEAALAAVIDTKITPKILRRCSGLATDGNATSVWVHYTPRALTAPIVTETLRPILERLGDDASAEDISASAFWIPHSLGRVSR